MRSITGCEREIASSRRCSFVVVVIAVLVTIVPVFVPVLVVLVLLVLLVVVVAVLVAGCWVLVLVVLATQPDI